MIRTHSVAIRALPKGSSFAASSTFNFLTVLNGRTTKSPFPKATPKDLLAVKLPYGIAGKLTAEKPLKGPLSPRSTGGMRGALEVNGCVFASKNR